MNFDIPTINVRPPNVIIAACERVRKLLTHLCFHDPIVKAILLACLSDFDLDFLLLLFREGKFVFSGKVSESIFFLLLVSPSMRRHRQMQEAPES